MNAGLIDLCHWCSLAFILCSQFVKSTVQCHRKWRQGKGKKTVSVISQRESRLWGLASCCSSLINFIVPRVFAAGDNWRQTGSLFPFFFIKLPHFLFSVSVQMSPLTACVSAVTVMSSSAPETSVTPLLSLSTMWRRSNVAAWLGQRASAWPALQILLLVTS